MAQKRRIEGGAPQAPPAADNRDEAAEEPDDFVSWVRWSYSKWWYVLLCLFIDLFIPVTLWEYLETKLIAEVLILTLLILVALEYVVYRLIWSREEEELEEEE
jgi:hypothetical protein